MMSAELPLDTALQLLREADQAYRDTCDYMPDGAQEISRARWAAGVAFVWCALKQVCANNWLCSQLARDECSVVRTYISSRSLDWLLDDLSDRQFVQQRSELYAKLRLMIECLEAHTTPHPAEGIEPDIRVSST